ncbi:hypothetical protein E0485_13840 [Paenibacillus albiflavus]|uniref:YfzA-like protein n=1 Tax=Paenibacillus albiflavus TaxID=2545760 RepID=A0A4R4EBZ4_9BACL|nr:YfzA family protein [Paenibacillus albiflavus]TCZ76663.1 hypothetical protein E0485_13840 [Paenibacillus albiflavus]
MTDTQKKGRSAQIRNWVITLGILLIMHLYFIIADGTSWVPNMNDSGNLMSRIFQSLLQMKLFTEWFTPYSYPYFNWVTVASTIAIIIAAIVTIISNIFSKK